MKRLALQHRQFGRGGGLERYLGGFALHLAEAGHDVQIVTSRLGPDAPTHRLLTVWRIPELPIFRAARLLAFSRDARRLGAKLSPDLVLGFGSTAAQDIHRAGGGCHAVYSRTLPLHKRGSLINRADLLLEKRIYTGGLTRHFVVNATKVAQEIQLEYGVPTDRITVIHTPVDFETFHPLPDASPEDRASLKQKLVPEADPNRPVFLFASLDHRRKGIEILLDVWPQVNAELWVAGPPLAKSHQRTVHDRGLRDRIRELGPRPDLPDLFRAADWFVHPTRYDACANTVLQSLACGLPGIISTRDGASEFVDDGKNGFLLRDPESETEVLDRIHTALALSPVERRAMAEAAAQRAAALTWTAHLQKWDTLFQRLSR